MMRDLDALATAQEALNEAGSDGSAAGALSRLICPGIGEGEADCVKSIRALPRLTDGGALSPPAQYLVCLKRPKSLPDDPRAAMMPRSDALERVGARLLPNVWYRMDDPRETPPTSADEKQAKAMSIANLDWAHKQIDYQGALARLAARRAGQRPGEGVVLAQLDTGFTPSCQFRKTPAADSIVLDTAKGFDYFACRDDPADPLTEAPLPLEARQPGHGTGTGTILASPHVSPTCDPAEPNGMDGKPVDRVIGIAPAATVIPVRVTDGIILGFPSASKAIMEIQGVSFDARSRALAAGLLHAIDQGANVVSISMGGVCADDEAQKEANRELQEWVLEAESRGLVIVAAAGQFPIPGFLRRLFFEDYPVTFPGSFPSSFTVAASSVHGIPWSQSSRGPKVDVTAPGFAVWRGKPVVGNPTRRDEIGVGDGTSFSTAITAGVAAIWVQYWGKDWLQQRYGGATASAFRLAVRRSAVQPADLDKRLAGEPYAAEIHRRVKPWDRTNFGAGLLDASRLLQVDLEAISKADVCREEAQRLDDNTDAQWRQRYQRICPSI
jgi:hypothetical protein